jgi:hypothetical protein
VEKLRKTEVRIQESGVRSQRFEGRGAGTVLVALRLLSWNELDVFWSNPNVIIAGWMELNMAVLIQAHDTEPLADDSLEERFSSQLVYEPGWMLPRRAVDHFDDIANFVIRFHYGSRPCGRLLLASDS